MFTSQGPSIRMFAFFSFVLGIECLRLSLFGGVPMPAQTHGGAMYQIPAEAWSLVIMIQAAALWWASRLGWLLAAIMAGMLGGVINIALFLFSQHAEFGFLLSRGAAMLGVLHLCVALAAVIEWRALNLRARLVEYLHRLMEGAE